jgi:rubrerythrin
MGVEEMENFKSVDELLDFAVAKEEDSACFYTNLAQRMQKPAMRQVFEEFAKEELGHKAKLLAVKREKLLAPAEQRVQDLRIADYLVEEEVRDDMEYDGALRLAMQQEKASFKLYMHLATATDNARLRGTLLNLAQEEAKHKLRFEIEYDDVILKGN